MARLSDLVRDQSHRGLGDGMVMPRSQSCAASAHRWHIDAKEELRRVRDAVRANASPRLDACRELAGVLVRELQQSDDCVRWALNGQTDDYPVDNALHVAVFSVKIGIGLYYSNESLEQLALAGLLHDVGMWMLPDSLLTKAGSLTTEEQVAVRAHPERGRRLLAGLGPSYAWIADIGAQEHERWDGSGYPCRLKGSQIAEPAQIIGAADVFDALITPRPYKKHIAPHHALRELLVHGKQLFAHRVLKSLGDHITLYPVGTTVRLSSGEIGTVLKVNPQYPLRPTVFIPHDGRSDGETEGNELDLGRMTSVHIVEVL